ncbi:hypothetical protein MTO96_020933 [Rhipicephalus appendiculatus]
MVADMITEGRLEGYIDQVDSLVHVKAREGLPFWNQQIESVCLQVNNIIKKIGSAAPNWMNKALGRAKWRIKLLLSTSYVIKMVA